MDGLVDALHVQLAMLGPTAAAPSDRGYGVPQNPKPHTQAPKSASAGVKLVGYAGSPWLGCLAVDRFFC